jgi:hypothetical protein
MSAHDENSFAFERAEPLWCNRERTGSATLRQQMSQPAGSACDTMTLATLNRLD